MPRWSIHSVNLLKNNTFLKNKFILASIIYTVILVILDTAGFFLRPPEQLIPLYNLPDTVITGKITSEPEQKPGFTYHEYGIVTDSLNSIPIKTKMLLREYSPEPSLSFNDVVTVTGKITLPLPVPGKGTNPGKFDYRKYLFRKNIYGIINTDKIEIIGKNPVPWWTQLTLYLQGKIIRSLDSTLDYEQSSILKKMFVGERGGLSEYIRDIFIDAGVMHVLVVSGMNVGYIIAAFWLLLRFIPVPHRYKTLLLIPPVILYALITGAQPPIVRATIMSIIVILSHFIYREQNIYHTLLLAMTFILVIDPQSLFGASLQLSFAACFGLIYISPKLNKLIDTDKIPKLIKIIITLFFVSLSCQIATSPILAYYFNKISIVSLISNLVVVPYTGIMLWLCFFHVFIYYFIPWLTPVSAWACSVLINFLVVIVDFFAKLPYSTIRVSAPSIIYVILYYIFIIILFRRFEQAERIVKPVKRSLIYSLILVLGFTGISIGINKILNKPGLQVIFLDVKLGDSIVITTPENKIILIDAGGSNPNTGDRTITPYLLFRGINKIDTVFITTDKWTHAAGLDSILKNFKVGRVLYPSQVNAGQVFMYPSGVKFTVKSVNPTTLSLEHSTFTILFTSDAGGDTIEKIVNSRRNKTQYSVIQIPSHGKKVTPSLIRLLKNSLCAEFVISTDKPNPRLMKYNSNIQATSGSGAIIFKFNVQ